MELGGVVAAAASLCGVLYAMGIGGDRILTREGKDRIADWLRRRDPGRSVNQWADTFASLFDRVFGSRHLSFNCFMRCSVASVASVLLLALFWFLTIPEHTELGFEMDSTLRLPTWASIAVEFRIETHLGDRILRYPLLTMLLYLFIVNLIPDYLSLLQTRAAIRFLQRSSSAIRTVLVLVADVIATAAIYFFAIFPMMWISLSITGREEPDVVAMAVRNFWQGASLLFGNDWAFQTQQGVYLYSSYFTSVGLWLYAVSGWLMRLAHGVDSLRELAAQYLNLDDHPLTCLASCMIVVVVVGSGLYLVVSLVLSDAA